MAMTPNTRARKENHQEVTDQSGIAADEIGMKVLMHMLAPCRHTNACLQVSHPNM